MALIECILSIDLQPEVFDHPTLSRLRRLIGDMIFTANVSTPKPGSCQVLTAGGLKDIYSYNKEQAGGHSANNLITVIEKEWGVGLQEAFDMAGQFFKNYVEEFVTCKELLPSWGPEVDEAVSRYITGLECLVSGGIEWCFGGPRYFGDSVEEVRRTRGVALAGRIA